MAKMRSILQCFEELQKIDPDTALTKTALRRLIVTGQIPSVRVGQKYLVSMEALEAYLTGSMDGHEPAPGYGQIRPVDSGRR